MNSFIKQQAKSPANHKVNLGQYEKQNMHCPVQGERKMCYFIPLNEINDEQHNPARGKGTQSVAVSKIIDSLITDADGQIEPICVERNVGTSEWDMVFGFNRRWAVASVEGYEIKNHPVDKGAGIWAYIFAGSPTEKTTLQLKENANKKPSSPATKDDVVRLLDRYIKQGGFDIRYSESWSKISDTDKRERAKNYMKETAPIWGGRKFKGVWNKLTQDGNPSVGLSFKTYSKDRLAAYYCAHNKLGITLEDLDSKFSGSVFEKNGTRYSIYFSLSKAEIAGALPTNATKKKIKENIDKVILVCSLNNSTAGGVEGARTGFSKQVKWWNSNVVHIFDEIYWMPQTKKETTKYIELGEFAHTEIL